MPAVYAYASEKRPSTSDEAPPNIRMYKNILREGYITSIPILNAHKDQAIPFIVLDLGTYASDVIDERLYLKRHAHYSLSMLSEDSLSVSTNPSELENIIKHKALTEIVENSTENFKTPESQLSAKVMTPVCQPLPAQLQLLSRSKQFSK
jgi:hypothetical protein